MHVKADPQTAEVTTFLSVRVEAERPAGPGGWVVFVTAGAAVAEPRVVLGSRSFAGSRGNGWGDRSTEDAPQPAGTPALHFSDSLVELRWPHRVRCRQTSDVQADRRLLPAACCRAPARDRSQTLCLQEAPGVYAAVRPRPGPSRRTVRQVVSLERGHARCADRDSDEAHTDAPESARRPGVVHPASIRRSSCTASSFSSGSPSGRTRPVPPSRAAAPPRPTTRGANRLRCRRHPPTRPAPTPVGAGKLEQADRE